MLTSLDFALKLPWFSINCIRYINDKTHKLRYVFKNGETGDLYFCVVLTLLHGQDLEEAIKAEEEQWSMSELMNQPKNGNCPETNVHVLNGDPSISPEAKMEG
jgi:hypothetical protein